MAIFYSDSIKGYQLKLTIEEISVSTENNTSTVQYVLQLTSGAYNSFSSYGLGAEITFDGETIASRDRYTESQVSIGYNDTLTILSGSTVVTHDTNGSKTIEVGFSMDMAEDSYTPGSMSGTGSLELTTITRYKLDVNYNVDGTWHYVGYAEAGTFNLSVDGALVKENAINCEYYAAPNTSYSITVNVNDGYIFTGATTNSGYQGLSGTYPSNDFGVGLQFRSAKTITYDANGGVGAPDQQIAYWGWETTLSNVEPTRAGYMFLGWSTNQSAETEEYLSDGEISVKSDTVLYAVWKQIGIIYIPINNVIKQGIPYVYHNSEWKQGVPYAYHNSEWKQGG